MTPSPRRVGVVGAGPAGLSAAYRLQRGGASVYVFEAEPEVGGRTRTEHVDGFRIDTATQLFGSMYTEFFHLLREVGSGDLAIRSPGRDALWRNGRAHEVVYGSVTSMLASGGLPLRTKMRLGTTYLPFLTRHAESLSMHALERAASAGLDSESIGSWGERELGRDFVEYLVYPLLASYYGVAPEETSAALYHMLARSGTNVAVYALRGGAAAFCQTLETEIRTRGGEIRLGTRVARVVTEMERATLSGDGWAEEFDAVVIAIPAVAAIALMEGVSADVQRWFGGVRYRSTVSLALLLDAPVGVGYFGLSFPRDESTLVSAVCVEENKAPGLVPDGRGLLVVFPTPAAGVRFMSAEPREVLDAMLPEVSRAFPHIERNVLRAKLYRWKYGWPIIYPGYLAHLRGFRNGGVEANGRIGFAGDYLYAPSVEGAVVSGTRAAEWLLARLQ
jgi:oxygen-dependent protoporphyrinogen oxidase